MLLSINANSGLVAYSSEWQRSSFIYPYLKIIFSPIAEVAPRLVVAVVLTALSFYLAFKRNVNRLYLPAALMGLSLTLYLLSPTGYPWYLLWILPFYPFLPLYGVGLLTVMVGLYYIRYAMGERGSYDIYSQFLVPLQFGLPILVIALEMKALRIKAAGEYDILVFLDGDASDYPEDITKLVAPIENGEADFVIGSRVLGRRETGALTVQQRLGNMLACRLIKLIWGHSYTDLGPFRAITREGLEALNMQAPTFGWTVEMQIRALKHNLRCQDVAVNYRKRIGKSKISGTLKGVVMAGFYILGTIFIEAIPRRKPFV